MKSILTFCILLTTVYANANDLFVTSYLTRELTEINVFQHPDVYPWISADGNRIYWGTENGIQYSYRPDTSSLFSTPLTILYSSTINSAWLTDDEFEFYVTNGDSLIHFHRPIVGAPWTSSQYVVLNNYSIGFISGANLSSNGNEMYLFENTPVNAISHFVKTGVDTFSFDHKIVFPVNFSPGPGQLSKDNLTFFDGGSVGGAKRNLYYMTRASVTDPFDTTTFAPVDGLQNLNAYMFQPSVSTNNEWLIYSYSTIGSFPYTDLYLAHDVTTVGVENVDKAEVATVFPNPANDQIFIRTKLNDVNCKLFTEEGRLVADVNSVSGKFGIETSALMSGLYLYTIQNATTTLHGKIMVMH